MYVHITLTLAEENSRFQSKVTTHIELNFVFLPLIRRRFSFDLPRSKAFEYDYSF
jgi:hypothetical protein